MHNLPIGRAERCTNKNEAEVQRSKIKKYYVEKKRDRGGVAKKESEERDPLCLERKI